MLQCWSDNILKQRSSFHPYNTTQGWQRKIGLRERVCVCEREGGRERECVCVCVCVCEGERERERERDDQQSGTSSYNAGTLESISPWLMFITSMSQLRASPTTAASKLDQLQHQAYGHRSVAPVVAARRLLRRLWRWTEEALMAGRTLRRTCRNTARARSPCT